MAYFQGPTVNLPEGNHSEISLEDGCQPEISFRDFGHSARYPKSLKQPLRCGSSAHIFSFFFWVRDNNIIIMMVNDG